MRLMRPIGAIGESAERNPSVAGDGRLSPALVGQPGRPDDLAAAGSKLLMGLSFHVGRLTSWSNIMDIL